ncbi:MAG: hypothetical protein ACLQRH_15680 [Acidimicrobiales bacterium]
MKRNRASAKLSCATRSFVAGALLIIGFTVGITAYVSTAVRAAPVVGSTPSGAPVAMEEFVNDGQRGNLWNQYDQTNSADGPMITGRPSAVTFGVHVQVFTLGQVDHLVDWVNDGMWGRVWNAYDLTQAIDGAVIVGSPAALVLGGQVYVFVEAVGGDLFEYVNDGANGRLWNNYDLSQLAQNGGPVDGDPAVVDNGGTLQVFVRASSGHLVEYARNTTSGGQWAVNDLSTTALDGQPAGSDPAAVLYAGTVTHVYVSSTSGDLLEYVDGPNSEIPWSAYDQTVYAGQGVQIAGNPAVVTNGSTVQVYARSSSSDLVEYVNDGTSSGHLWNVNDLTTGAGGGGDVTGDPSAVVDGTATHVYTRSLTDHLLEFVNDGASGHTWNTYDLTLYAGNATTIGSDPSAMVYMGSSIHVYAGGPDPALANGIVQLAESQDQYNAAVAETPPDSNCNPYTAAFGRGSTAGCAPGTSSEEWCSDFAQWVWTRNGVDTYGITGYAYTFLDWGVANHSFQAGATNDPLPGDAVVWGSTAEGYSPHVGLVVSVKDGDIDIVSGNSGPVDAQGNVVDVWESGYFDPTTATVDGYPILGYVAP